MDKVTLTCPRCQEYFKSEKSDVYECPKCGTTVRAESGEFDHDKTQIFNI